MLLPLKKFQREALSALDFPSHIICVAPTGSGKSLIYERFSANPGVRTVLFTPLVALARQQRQRFVDQGLKVSLGTQPDGEGPPPLSGKESGIWIMSPEKLFSPTRHAAIERLKNWRPNFMVVDECHCLWEWGQDFRPAYRKLGELVQWLQPRNSLWLSATLPLEAREEIRRFLNPAPIELGQYATPEELSLYIKRVPRSLRGPEIHRLLGRIQGDGIIFAPTRASTSRIQNLIHAMGYSSRIYHAGMSAEERRGVEAAVRNRECRVVIATSAFGLGMDFSHLKWVILWQPPLSLLALAQSLGRVGRQRQPGTAIAFWDPDDFLTLDWGVRGKPIRRKQLVLVRQFLEARRCRSELLSAYFQKGTLLTGGPLSDCGRCDVCVEISVANSDATWYLGVRG